MATLPDPSPVMASEGALMGVLVLGGAGLVPSAVVASPGRRPLSADAQLRRDIRLVRIVR